MIEKRKVMSFQGDNLSTLTDDINKELKDFKITEMSLNSLFDNSQGKVIHYLVVYFTKIGYSN